MKSPAAEWTLGIGYLLVLDIIRARGEGDGDTLSECTRELVAKHPRGRHMLAVALAGASVWFWDHICRSIPVESPHEKRPQPRRANVSTGA